MSSLLPSRRRADEFARLLEGAPATNDPTLAPLATLAMALRSLPVGPAPDFRAGLRQRLVAVATVQGIGTAVTAGGPAAVIALPGARTAARPAIGERLTEWAEGWRVRRRLVAATATLSAVVMVGGIGLAGSRSLPGEPFYGVKRGVESLQLAAARGEQAKGIRHLQFARTRLKEVSALVGSTSALGVSVSHTRYTASSTAFGSSLTSRVRSTLSDMDHETRAGMSDLTNAYQHSRSQKPLHILSTFATEQSARITAVLPDLPTSVTSQAAESLVLVQRVGSQADQLLANATCTAACQATTTTPNGVTKTPAPGSTPAPCTCTPGAPGNGSGTTSSPDTQGSDPALTPSPQPSDGSPPPPTHSPSPSPSPTQPSLQDQIGGILSQLPIPIPTPPIPLPNLPVPNPLPTIHLP
jgi:hypothetical protein